MLLSSVGAVCRLIRVAAASSNGGREQALGAPHSRPPRAWRRECEAEQVRRVVERYGRRQAWIRSHQAQLARSGVGAKWGNQFGPQQR